MQGQEQQARECLRALVEHVFEHRNDFLTGITYEDLAERIGRFNKRNVGQAHGMGRVLGKMGNLLRGLEGEWGEKIPHIQSLVVNKAGADKGLPDEGIKEFWPDYPTWTREVKRNYMRKEHQKVAIFGSRWNDVLALLSIAPIESASSRKSSRSAHAGSGESPQHLRLKDYVRGHPEVVGADDDSISFTEYVLPSLDQIDVVFKTGKICIAVEVKSSLSDTFPDDYLRGLYQVIKYDALLRAMALAGVESIPANIKAFLVLESALPKKLRILAQTLGVTVVENVRVGRPSR